MTALVRAGRWVQKGIVAASEFAHQQQIDVLYANHHGWLQTWLRRKLGCMHHAADVAQDTFVRIMASRDALLGMDTPRAYLTTTAKRLLVDRARRQAIEQAYLAELAPLADSQARYPSPDEILMAVEALVQIGDALEGAAPRVRDAFLRHYLDEQAHATIAADFGVSKRMVQKYLVQALLHCRAHCMTMTEHGV